MAAIAVCDLIAGSEQGLSQVLLALSEAVEASIGLLHDLLGDVHSGRPVQTGERGREH